MWWVARVGSLCLPPPSLRPRPVAPSQLLMCLAPRCVCVCVHILNVFASICTAIIWGGLGAPTHARPQSPGDEQEQEQEKEQEREGGAIEGHRERLGYSEGLSEGECLEIEVRK